MAEEDIPEGETKAAGVSQGTSSRGNSSKLLLNARNMRNTQQNGMECSIETQTQTSVPPREHFHNGIPNSTANVVSLLLEELVINAVENACLHSNAPLEHSQFPRPPQLPMSFDQVDEHALSSRDLCEESSDERMLPPSVTAATATGARVNELSDNDNTGCPSCREVFCAVARQLSNNNTADSNTSTAKASLLQQYTAKGPFNNLTFNSAYSRWRANRPSCLGDSAVAHAIDQSLSRTPFSLPDPFQLPGSGSAAQCAQNDTLQLANVASQQEQEQQLHNCTQETSTSAQFDWSRSRACSILGRFQKWAVDVYTSQQVIEGKKQEVALAKAEAAKSLSTVRPLSPTRESQSPPEIVDPVLWAAQEEALAAVTLRDLRIQFSKNKKFNSRSVAEGSSLWSFLAPNSSKLTPEAAAEMARARIAAAAASAAMRESKPSEEGEEESDRAKEVCLDGRDDVRGSLFPRIADDSLSAQYDTVPFSAKMIPLIRAPMKAQSQVVETVQRSEPSSTTLRLSTGSKKKKVEFAADTVFTRKRYR